MLLAIRQIQMHFHEDLPVRDPRSGAGVQPQRHDIRLRTRPQSLQILQVGGLFRRLLQ